jgi:hypothetical protein
LRIARQRFQPPQSFSQGATCPLYAGRMAAASDARSQTSGGARSERCGMALPMALPWRAAASPRAAKLRPRSGAGDHISRNPHRRGRRDLGPGTPGGRSAAEELDAAAARPTPDDPDPRLHAVLGNLEVELVRKPMRIGKLQPGAPARKVRQDAPARVVLAVAGDVGFLEPADPWLRPLIHSQASPSVIPVNGSDSIPGRERIAQRPTGVVEERADPVRFFTLQVESNGPGPGPHRAAARHPGSRSYASGSIGPARIVNPRSFPGRERRRDCAWP